MPKIAAAVALLLFVAACGGDDSADSVDTTLAAGEATSTTVAEETTTTAGEESTGDLTGDVTVFVEDTIYAEEAMTAALATLQTDNPDLNLTVESGPLDPTFSGAYASVCTGDIRIQIVSPEYFSLNREDADDALCELELVQVNATPDAMLDTPAGLVHEPSNAEAVAVVAALDAML